MLEPQVTPARRRLQRVAMVAGVAGVLAVIGIIALLMHRREPVAPVTPATLAPAPARAAAAVAPAPAANDPRVGEAIVYVASASDAPVIAVASAHHVWISRDDGKTFVPAVADARGELYALAVEPAGRVYAMWGENKKWSNPGGGSVDTIEFTLGIAELDGRERWRAIDDMVRPPLDVRGGWIVGTGGAMIGHDAGDAWSRVPSANRWHMWLGAVDDAHTVRYLASFLDAPDSCEDCARGLTLLEAREGHHLTKVWSMLDKTAISTDDFPANVMACAGFAGTTLYLVARDRHGARLLAITADGKAHEKEPLPAGIDPDTACTIAGNDRAAYMSFGNQMIRIDPEDERVAPAGAITPQSAGELGALAVDAHGYLLYLADACVWRYGESGAGPRNKIVCGPHRR